MLRVIVNSTPLLILGKIGKLEILHKMYQEIIIPQAVFHEVTKKNDIAGKAVQAACQDWIKVEAIKDMREYAMYRAKLHAGEVEVMIIAQQSPKADLIILDDMAARKTAEFLGLPLSGTIGVLIKAKQKGIIPEVMPIIEEMEKSGFFISIKVKSMIANKTGESL